MRFISIFVVFTIIFSCILTHDVKLHSQWKLWKETYNKQYTNVQEQIRRRIWEENLKKVEEHNDQADRDLYTYRLGMNKYGDMTLDEFIKTMNGYNNALQRNRSENDRRLTFNSNINDLPSFVDWRDKDVVTDIRDQGECGSDWAFSAIGALEGQTAIHSYNLIYLSEQNLIDCSQKQGNMGCKGGTMNQAFTYIAVNGGIDTETSYPYEGKDLQCRFKKEDVAAQDTGYVNLPSDEKALQNAVAKLGPISVAIDANHSSFQLYKSGIYDEPTCSQANLNHAVLVIGYGTDSNVDYWLVKNSWGLSWGMDGYIRMSRNKNNQCGIATAATYPTV